MGRVPSRGTDQFVVRFPEGLRERIKDAADRSGRSMNAEILRVLEREFPPNPPLGERLAEIHDLLNALAHGEAEQAAAEMQHKIERLVIDIVSGRVEVDEETRSTVVDRMKTVLAKEEWRRARHLDEEEEPPF